MVDFSRLEEVRRRRPLVHCVSNLVSASDCANLALAMGASPIMAQAPQEAAAITAASAATVLNTGTPEEEKFRACLTWGREAAGRQPLVLDPVGVGASPWRLAWVQTLLKHFTPAILRVNLGEALALTARPGREQGVDSFAPASGGERLSAAKSLARQEDTVVLLSGPGDMITDGSAAWTVSGGSSRMTQVTGTGCMLSVLCGIFAAVEPEPVSAALLASCFWKVCAQRAELLSRGQGPGSFRAALIDAAAVLTAEDLAREARLVSR